jgi:hypothetical protein
MPGKILIALMLLLSGSAGAHVGFENTTDVRIYPDRMEIVTRTSLALAWALLGPRAPATTDPSGQAAAQPFLLEEAPRLLEVDTGSGPMTPVRTNCVFEVHDDVAFTLVFQRPETWPVTIRAGFTRLLGDMDRGTVSFYDHTTAGYKRDIKPLVVRPVSRRHPEASFSLVVPAVERPLPRHPPGKQTDRRIWPLPLALVALGIVVHLIRRRRAAGRH